MNYLFIRGLTIPFNTYEEAWKCANYWRIELKASLIIKNNYFILIG